MARATDIPQSAVLAYCFEAGTPKVLMITSRGRRRWVLPKGRIEEGHTAKETALLEAFEEAGIRGEIATKIGSYSYTKLDQSEQNSYKVRVYPMEVASMSDEWPEKNERDRLWMDFTSAAKAVEEPELRSLLHDFGDMLSTLVAQKA